MLYSKRQAQQGALLNSDACESEIKEAGEAAC